MVLAEMGKGKMNGKVAGLSQQASSQNGAKANGKKEDKDK